MLQYFAPDLTMSVQNFQVWVISSELAVFSKGESRSEECFSSHRNNLHKFPRAWNNLEKTQKTFFAPLLLGKSNLQLSEAVSPSRYLGHCSVAFAVTPVHPNLPCTATAPPLALPQELLLLSPQRGDHKAELWSYLPPKITLKIDFQFTLPA